MGALLNWPNSSKSQDKRPVKLWVGNMKMYLVFGADNVALLFGNSKHLARDNLTKQAFHHSNTSQKPPENTKGHSLRANAKKIAEIGDEEAARIGRKLHDMQHLYLSQPSEIKAITDRFSGFLQEQIEDSLKPSSNVTLGANDHKHDSPYQSKNAVSLFQFLKHRMFIASTAALMGTRILELNRNLIEDYWAYDEAFLLGLPELMYPAGESARDRLLSAVKHYVEEGYKAEDRVAMDNSTWDRHFGCKLFRASLQEMSDGGIAVEDQAGAILSLVWATASNSIPLTGWILASLLEQPQLHSELRKEILLAVDSRPNTDSTTPDSLKTLSFDMSRLSSLPLLNSIYHECLRLRASVTVTRRLTADIEIGGYTLRTGAFVMTPSYLAHIEPIAWNDKKGYGARHFRPKRFTNDEKTAAATLKAENFFPYGGGNAICPGRFFSKQQILVATAIIILKLDMELEGYVGADRKAEIANAPEPDQRYAGGGVMPPEGDWVMKIRRRGDEKRDNG